MRSHLKVKVVSLSSEMTYIRRQEEKWKERARIARKKVNNATYAEMNFWTLREHRTELKVHARTAHLAYGFMKGVAYREMEAYCHGWRPGCRTSEPDWTRIAETVERFARGEHDSTQAIMQRFAEWLEAAKEWFAGNGERWEAKQKRRELFKRDAEVALQSV